MLTIKKSDKMDALFDVISNQIYDNFEYMMIVEEYHNLQIDAEQEEDMVDEINKVYDMASVDLQYDLAIIEDNEYNKCVKLDTLKGDGIEVDKVIVPYRTVHNMGFITNRYLLDGYLPIGYYDNDVEYTVLKNKDGKVWMSITRSEIESIQRHIDEAKGDICTVGLGIGYYVYMCMRKEEVSSITVIEKDAEVIELFKNHILPQFKDVDRDKLVIIQDDLMDVYVDLCAYDYVFIDTWKNDEDGLNNFYIPLMEKWLPNDNITFWIEDSMLYTVRLLVALYLRNVYLGGSISDFMSSASYYNSDVAIKINRYFKSINREIDSVDEIKEMIGSKYFIREILAHKKNNI